MNKKLTLGKSVGIALFAVVLVTGGAVKTMASPFVLNGGFEFTTNGPNAFLPTLTMPTGWSYDGGVANVAYVYGSGDADTIGGNAGGGIPVYLWGPGNPTNPTPNINSMNGLTASSPNGGNYLASDSDPSYSGAIYQIINGLNPGSEYELTFWYAAAQFRNTNGTFWNGATHSLWQVSLGLETYDTPDLNIIEHGFSGWIYESHTFTVPTTSNGSEVLKFLAVGGPGGLPPVALLDGVSLASVPEPETLAMLGIGLLGMLAARRIHKKHA